MPSLTQRQAALGALSLMLGVGVSLFIYYLTRPAANPQLLIFSAGGSGLVGLMLLAYQRGWEFARPGAVILVTVIEAFAIANPREASLVSFGVFLPPVLAAVLTGSRGVLASALSLWSILIIRAGGEGVYTLFYSWVVYGACITGLIVARWVTETAQRRAEASARAAQQQAAELQRTSQAIQQAEQSYRRLFEDTLEGIYRSSLEGRMLRANPALVRLNGYTTEAELLAAVNDIAAEWYVLPHRRAEFQQALAVNDQITDFESEIYRHKTRERIWISESARLVRAPDGTPLWYEGTVQDITARKRVETALTHKINQLATVTDVSAAASTILEPQQLVQVVVDLTKEKFGLYHAQIYLLDGEAQILRLTAGAGEAGKQMRREGWQIALNQARSLVARTARRRLSALVNDVRREPDFLPNHWLPQTRSELAVPMLVGDQLLGVFDAQSEQPGRFTDEDLVVYTALARQMAVALENARRYTLAQTEIVERKRAEQALRQSEARYRSVTEGLAHFIFVVQDGLVEYMNSHWTDYTGLPAEAGLQRGWTQVQHPDDYAPLMQHWRATMRTGQRSESEHRIRRADGQYRWHRTILQPVRDDTLAQTKWIGLTVDIHDQKEVEARIRQMNETLEARVQERTAQLEAANRELESFTYSVSHDLRAPLRAMDGFSRLLLQDYASALPEAAQSHLNRIRGGAQRMAALIDDLLAFARFGRQALTKQRIALKALVGQVWAEMQTGTSPLAAITIQDLPDCYADPALLRQVFTNLLDNARKFTQQTAAPRIEVGYERRAPDVIYFVRDNGAGFDMRYADKLFGVFQRLHPLEDYAGTGVGLAIVQRIIQRHGGRVWAEGEVGRGATFYFTLG